MSPPTRALIVDDDPKFLRYVSRGLEHSGVECRTTSSPEDALRILGEAEETGFDIVLLDVMMPTSSGFDVLQALRRRGVEIPVIFVTARDAVDERIRGLECGADDYIIKPFAFQELLARIRAVLRRRDSVPLIEHASLLLDPVLRRVRRGDRWIELSAREFNLLFHLVQAGGRVMTRTELLTKVWDIDFDPGTNVVDVLVGRLRRRLDTHGPSLIETVKGEGYRIVAAEEC